MRRKLVDGTKSSQLTFMQIFGIYYWSLKIQLFVREMALALLLMSYRTPKFWLSLAGRIIKYVTQNCHQLKTCITQTIGLPKIGKKGMVPTGERASPKKINKRIDLLPPSLPRYRRNFWWRHRATLQGNSAFAKENFVTRVLSPSLDLFSLTFDTFPARVVNYLLSTDF